MASAGDTKLRRGTIRSTAVLSGVDRTGRKTTIKIAPAPIGRGISFNGVVAGPQTARVFRHSTMVGGVGVVEHLLAACQAVAVTDLTVECSGRELPICDGSALPYVRLLKKAGVARAEEIVSPLKVQLLLTMRWGGRFCAVVPAERLRLTCLVHVLKMGFRYFSVSPAGKEFVKKLAPARTFGRSTMRPPVLRQRLRLQFRLRKICGWIIPAYPRFPDELWRHKVVDLAGDLWLLGRPLLGNLLVFEPGHSFNLRLVRWLTRITEMRDDT